MDLGDIIKWVMGLDVGNTINLASVLVAIAIAVFAYRTYKSQTHPKIIVYTHHDYLRRGLLKIRIHNIGKDVATDISLEMEHPIPDIRGPLSTGSLPSLAPGEYRESMWGTVWTLKEKTAGKTYSIKYKYHHNGKALCGEDVIETDSYDEELISLSPYQDIVKALEDKLSAVENKLNDVSVLGRAWKEYVTSRRCKDSEE